MCAGLVSYIYKRRRRRRCNSGQLPTFNGTITSKFIGVDRLDLIRCCCLQLPAAAAAWLLEELNLIQLQYYSSRPNCCFGDGWFQLIQLLASSSAATGHRMKRQISSLQLLSTDLYALLRTCSEFQTNSFYSKCAVRVCSARCVPHRGLHQPNLPLWDCISPPCPAMGTASAQCPAMGTASAQRPATGSVMGSASN